MGTHVWKVSTAVLTLAALTTVGTGAIAAPIAEPAAIAQAGSAGPIIGQCRAVNKSTAVYQAASTTSPVVRVLATDARVTLASNGSAGFIAISAPVNGFVQTANLKPCPDGNPNPPGNTCRRVTQPLGLVIRRNPDTNSAAVGGADFNQRVYLTTNPATSKVGPDGRVWVQLAQPAAGWVSNGFQGTGTTNLVYCAP